MITASPRHSIPAMVINALGAGLAAAALMAFILLARDLATPPAGDPQATGTARQVLVRHLDRARRVPATPRHAGPGVGR
jgi:hypothetical protein